MASFSSTSQGLSAAVAIQRGIHDYRGAEPEALLRVYIGLNASEPIAEADPEGRIDLFGTSVDLAKRICDQCQPGEILVSDVVRQLAAGKEFLFSDRGETALRGFEDPVRLHEVQWRDTPTSWGGDMASEGPRTVVITGASTGIGEACALRMDRLGWRVFAGVRKEADGQALREKASEKLTPITLDVTEQPTIDASAETVTAAVGESGLAGLINNAGVGVGGPLEFISVDELRRQLEVNVIGQIAVTQAFMPLIRKATGRIVNMGSIGGRMATPFLGPYNASKFAMEALTDSLRQELHPWGIHVSIIEPGSISTPIWEKSKAAIDELKETLPEEAMMLYGETVEAVEKALNKFEAAGIPPDEVAKFAEHALTARTPKTRYVVGRDAQLQRMLVKWAPDRVRDMLVRSQLGLPGKK